MEEQVRPSSAVWPVLTAAPHRGLFAVASVQLVFAMLVWAAELAARAPLGLPAIPFALPAPWIHGFLMLYGVFPFLVFGFLLTVYPRWLGLEPVSRPVYVRVFVLLAAGAGLYDLGIYFGRAWAGVGVLFLIAGWAAGLHALLGVAWRARTPGSHVQTLNLALVAGGLGLFAYAWAALSGSPGAYVLAREAGLWLFLVPVIYTVSHRMIPFFSNTALRDYTPVRPGWSLPVMAVAVLGHFACEIAGVPEWRFLFDAPLAAAAFYHSWAWGLRRSFEVRLLAMLHLAFLWLGVGMALYALDSLSSWFGAAALGRAPLHALGIGFIAGMAIAMGSRVTLGHSGRPLAADTLTWAVLLALNGVAIVRIAAELLPAGTVLNLFAALGWLAAMGTWAVRYAPMYLRARVDGKAG